jgi:outer membrane protein assembly factor BamB
VKTTRNSRLIVGCCSVMLTLLIQVGVQFSSTAQAARAQSAALAQVAQYLPWTAGQTWAVSQGNDITLDGTCVSGCFSHNDAYDRYAWDFYYPPAPGGQPILAAAPGTVVAVINDVSGSSYISGKGCTSMNANEVLLQYGDGTYGIYLHLMQEPRYPGTGNNGWVQVGQHVALGQQIGRTGETGCATGYHLHYSRMAYENVNGASELESIPSTFVDVPGGIPQQGDAYTSGNRGVASTPTPVATVTPMAPAVTATPPVGLETSPTPTPLTPGPTDWPTFQHDQARSGATTSHLTPSNVATLVQRWLFSTVPGVIQTAPAIAANTVFVGLTNGFFYAINLKDGSLRWSYTPDDGTPYACMSAPDVAAGLVLFTSCNGYAYALNATTGKLAWQYQATKTVSSALITATPVHNQRAIYVATGDGQISALMLATGKLEWHVQLPGAVVGSPALAGGRLYVTVTSVPNTAGNTPAMRSAVYALDARTGHVSWMRQSPTPLTSAPALGQDILYVGDQRGVISALSADTGRVLWRAQGNATITAPPAVTASSVYVAAQNGLVAALDPLTGVTQWAANLPAALEAAPVVSNGVLFLADDSGTLRALDASNGAQLWAQNIGAPSGLLLSSPAIAGDTLAIGGSALTTFSPAALQAAPTATATQAPTPTAAATLAPTPTATASQAPTPTVFATATPASQSGSTPASADRSTIIAEITTIFGSYAPAALKVADCESGYDAFAYNPIAVGNSHAEGVFQILYPSTWDTTPYRTASPYDALANIKAAYAIFQRDGYSWREWECQP